MNTSKHSSRCRPGLGTLIRVQVDNESLIEPIYERLQEIEKIFNFHNPSSELSRWNRGDRSESSVEFRRLLEFATGLRATSEGAFTPYLEEQSSAKSETLTLDLGGVAKGFAVDEAVELALNLDSGAKGFVEAGGDIRYFGQAEVEVALRLGVPPDVVTRKLKLTGSQMAVASSSAGMAEHFGQTKTKLSFGNWPLGTSITVLAESCRVADAMTKVILFGNISKFSSIDLKADALVFDATGELVESTLL